MAKTNYKEISVGSASGVTWYLKLVLTETDYSVENNTSTVIRQLYLRAANTAYSISFDNRSAWIGDNKQTIAYTQSGKEHLLFEDYVIVEHNSDGTGSYSTGFGISTSFALNGSSSCSLPLTIIPRATTPVLSSEEYEMGTTISITLDRAVSTFTHNLYFKVGTSAKTLIARDIETSFNWTDNLYLINWIDTSDRGTVTIYCDTYNGDTYIGEKSATFTGIVPSGINPKIESVTISEATEGIAEKFGVYVKDKSTLKVDIVASGNYSSTIKTYTTAVNGVSYSGQSIVSGILDKSGAITVSSFVTDSRGRTVLNGRTIGVVDYYTPKITDFSVERCDSNGNLVNDDTAKYLLITFGYDIAPVNNKNDKRAVLQYYDLENDSWIDITAFTNVYKREVSDYKTTVEFDVDKSYEIRLVLTDFFNTEENISISRMVEPTYTLINYHESGTGMAIGTVATQEETFEVGLENTILKNTAVNGNLIISDEEGNNSVNVLDEINGLVVDSLGEANNKAPSQRAVKEELNKLTTYSTSERIIGTWIDGKPIYRKVVNCNALPTAYNLKNVSHGISNLDYVVSLKGIATNGDSFLSLPRVHTTSSLNIVLEISKTDIVLYTEYDFSTYSGYAIVEYTKTTD